MYDAERPVLSFSATTPEMVNKVYGPVSSDRQWEVCKVANELNISTEHLDKHLDMKKPFARLVTCLLNADEMRARIQMSGKHLDIIKQFFR